MKNKVEQFKKTKSFNYKRGSLLHSISVKRIAVLDARRQAYVTAKVDIESLLDSL